MSRCMLTTSFTELLISLATIFQMPPKKSKTRHSSASILGPACPLPDIGSLYTGRDVLAVIEKLEKVFDIVVRQCPIEHCSKSDCNPAHCSNGFHISCSCERDFKIPTMELRYLLDQREKVGQRGGSMQMTKVDKAEV